MPRLIDVLNAEQSRRNRNDFELTYRVFSDTLAGMAESTARKWVVGGLCVLGVGIFCVGINWGLPTHAIDPLILGAGGKAQTDVMAAYQLRGEGIERLAGDLDESGNVAADVALHPIGDRSEALTLLENRRDGGDAGRDAVNRARILRRYRLYSYQPDEMITFRALAMMHPGARDFDPKLYQYGGLWVYPVGAILKAASLVGLVTVNGDRAYYLDYPEAFGRFYIVARGYSAAWGLIGMLAVFALVRRAAGGLLLPAMAGICFLCLPVVVDLGHEAKPHLAGTAILLWALVAAGKYVESGRWKWIVWTAIACGAAAGMVLSGVVGLLILPLISLRRRDDARRFAGVCFAALVIPAAVYFATNPYVAIHLLGNRALLESNFGNTSAMYVRGPIGESLVNAARLVAIGTSWPVAIVGGVAVIAMLCCRCGKGSIGWVMGPVVVVVLAQFVLYAWNKPGEYARFALFADVGLMLAAFLAVGRFVRNAAGRAVVCIVLVGCTCTYSFAYERGFLRDSLADDSRVQAGKEIEGRVSEGGKASNLYIVSEPAPYCLPPVDLFGWRIVLLPRDERGPAAGNAGTLVRVKDSVEVLDPSDTPISWADKSFEVVAVTGK
jgi:hypothetical protein